MRINLIVSTLNRHIELRALLQSLATQSRSPDKVIIVDQSDNDLSQTVAQEFQNSLKLEYVRHDLKGLSRGRNFGLQFCDGDIVGFPDDDCEYPEHAVDTIVSAFKRDARLGILSGMSVSQDGRPSQGRWANRSHRLHRYNVWVSQTSYTTFYRYDALKRVDGFEETLGVGAGTKWGAGEETDLMLRALRAGAKGLYDHELRIRHPEPIAAYNQAALLRGTRYNRGFGRVLRRNSYPLWFVGYMVARPAIGALLSILKMRSGEARYRTIASSQRLLGWIDS